MPVYAYVCRDCGNAFDIRQEFTDAALTVCESCGGRLRKQFGSIGVTFSGSGFYRTDSRAESSASKPAKAAAETKSSPTPAPASGSGTKTSAPATSA